MSVNALGFEDREEIFCHSVIIAVLSQEAFAKELGISFTTVNRWETGKAKPTYKTMKLINDYCQAHNIDFDVREELEGAE